MADNPLLVAGVAAGQRDPAAAARLLAAAHHVVRETGGRVVGSLVAPGAGRNYYAIRVEDRDGARLRLLLNAAIGLVAAADDTDPHALVHGFREVPRPDVYGLAGFRVATAQEMEQPLTDRQTTGLTGAELKDIAYHRPPRVGDVIFNWFD